MGEFFEWRQAPTAEFAVLGDPISHSRSPVMHQAWLDLQRPGLRYVALRVPEHEICAALGSLKDIGYIGVNCTIPLKEAATHWLNSSDELTRRIGAVNTIRMDNRHGINTDGPGFIESLHEHDIPPGSEVLVLGAGGSARAVVAALSEHGFPISIWNRTKSRAERLLSETGIKGHILDAPDVDSKQLVVNCTSGTSDVELPLDWSRAPADAVAYDLMYGRVTPFLQSAAANGLRSVDGMEMLVCQGALAMEFWLDTPVDRSVYRDALRSRD